MKDLVVAKIELILKRYEKLGLTSSSFYQELKHDLTNDKWLDEIVDTITKVRNGEKIFDVVGQITAADNDHRIVTMFAEYDTARRLTDWAKDFFGTFTDAEYLPRKNKKQPDFKVWNNGKVLPVETKTLGDSAAIIEAEKFNNKFLKKISQNALPQLASFYEETPFDEGIIFVWTQLRIQPNEDRRVDAYWNLRQQVERDIDMSGYAFDVKIITMFTNPLDLWDFRLKGGKTKVESKQPKPTTLETPNGIVSITFVETQAIKDGVTADLYTIDDDSTKDLAIVHVTKGHKTPLQRILKGTRTIEGYMSGNGMLAVTAQDGSQKTHTFTDNTGINSSIESEVHIGELMQWSAETDLTFYEICEPPYEDGRFENIPE
jgi:hypothetical protein